MSMQAKQTGLNQPVNTMRKHFDVMVYPSGTMGKINGWLWQRVIKSQDFVIGSRLASKEEASAITRYLREQHS